MSTDIHDTAPLRIGLVSISDRASSGTYEDRGIPALAEWLDSGLAMARLQPAGSRRTGRHQQNPA